MGTDDDFAALTEIHVIVPLNSSTTSVDQDIEVHKSRAWKIVYRDEDKLRQLGRAVLAEFVGTLLLIGIAIGLANPRVLGKLEPVNAILYSPSMRIGVSLAVGTIIYMGLPISGGHINPAVSLGLFLDKRISALRLFLYCTAQFIGGIAGGGLIFVLCNYKDRPSPVIGIVSYDLETYTYVQVFFNEVFGTMVLVLAVYVTFLEPNQDLNYLKCLVISLTCLMADPMCCLNPARGLAFNLITLQRLEVDSLGISVFGPLLGAVVAAVIFNTILKKN